MTAQSRTWDVDNKLLDMLSVSAMNAVLEGNSRVIKSNFGVLLEIPKADYWNRLVLMPRTKNFGPRQYDDTNRKYEFMLRADTYPPDDLNFDVKRKLEAVHSVAFDLLQGQALPEMNNAEMFFSIRRSSFPTNPRRDPSGFFYSSANYFLMIRGK